VWLSRLTPINFRNLRRTEISLSSGINFFVGDNGAGKSSILETALTLARGRVLSGYPQERTGPMLEGWSIEALVQPDIADKVPTRLKMRWQKSLDLRVDDLEVSAADMSRRLIVACLSGHSHGLFANGPDERRRFLDWTLFHVEHNYGALWARWRRLLKQRNRALQQGADNRTIQAWDEPLSEATDAITASRAHLVEFFSAALAEASPWVTEGISLELGFDAGWDRMASYRDVLSRQLDQDRQRGRTGQGAQRADLVIRSGNKRASVLSRGQQKLALGSILLAACRRITSVTGETPILMVDDFEAELANTAKKKLAGALLEYPGQLLITQHVEDQGLWQSKTPRVFHVEHGEVALAVE
jgi:DNA replication and repair protein RecF